MTDHTAAMRQAREALADAVLKNDYGNLMNGEELQAAALAVVAIDAALAKVQEPVAFDGYLCRAWGETKLPAAQVVPDLDGVRAFMVREWLGSNDDPTLADVMAEIEGRDWKDDGEWSAKFEIGGVSVELVYSYTAPPAPSATVLTDAEFDAITLEVTGFDGFGTQPMNYVDTRRIARAAIEAAILKGQQ